VSFPKTTAGGVTQFNFAGSVNLLEAAACRAKHRASAGGADSAVLI